MKLMRTGVNSVNKVVYEHFDVSGMSFSDIEKKIEEKVIFLSPNCLNAHYDANENENEMTLIETSEVFMENYRSLPILIKKELILTKRHTNLTNYLETLASKNEQYVDKNQLGEFHDLSKKHMIIITNVLRFGTVEEVDELLNVLNLKTTY